MAKSVWIPETYFMGKRAGGNLAFITPDGENSQAKKRKETVKSWAKNRYYKKIEGEEPSFETFKNEPISGFKLVKEVTRWSTSNVVWRVEDPRGFEIEVYSGNMSNILQHATIEKGELKGEFVYGREGAKNVLLPLDTDLYRNAIEGTELRGTKPLNFFKEVAPGDHVTIRRHGQDMKMIYVGNLYNLTSHSMVAYYRPTFDSRGMREREFNFSYNITPRPSHVFISPDDLNAEKYTWFRVEEIVKPVVLKVNKRNAEPDALAKYRKLLERKTADYNDRNDYHGRYRFDASPEKADMLLLKETLENSG